jgi:CRP-like cAMP-binding protein
MNKSLAFWSILEKDMKNYYLKPPNISWGIIFPVSWTLMFFIRSNSEVDIRGILPGVMALSILFGTTSMLAVTITFERRSRSFERLLLAPISLNILMLAKTTGAILFGIINAFIPVLFASFIVDLSGQVQIVLEDFYGNRSILAQIGKGNLFGESFAFAENESLPVFVIAAAESKLLFLDCRRLASPCANSCAYHRQLIQNMLKILALKNISLTQKIELVSKKTIREKLLAYLSAEAQKAGKSSFSIPFDRQGLADYLSVDRSAMSAVLSKLRNEGIINFNKNKFELLKQQKNLPSKNNI